MTVQDHRSFCPGRGRWTAGGERCQRPGPAGVASDQLAGTVALGPQRPDVGHMRQLAQGFEKAALGGPVQFLDAQIERRPSR